MGSGVSIERISTTPVKCFRLGHPDSVFLGPEGVAGNRRFLLLGADGERLRSSQTAWPVVVSADYDPGADVLEMRFPDGEVVSGEPAPEGDGFVLRLGGREQRARLVPGPWDERLSALGGREVRLARVERDGAAMVAPVTLVSSASVARLAREAGVEHVDARRFRPLFELAGCDEHEEELWAGRRLAVGEAAVEVGGPVERCAVTTRDPDTGERDLDALRLIKAYRGQGENGEIFFARYAWVVDPGEVRVGDSVELL